MFANGLRLDEILIHLAEKISKEFGSYKENMFKFYCAA